MTIIAVQMNAKKKGRKNNMDFLTFLIILDSLLFVAFAFLLLTKWFE